MLSQCHDEIFIYFYNSIMSNDEVNDEIGLGDKTIDYDETIGLKLGVVFPDKKSAEKSIRRWCDSNFCPLAKVSKVQ